MDVQSSIGGDHQAAGAVVEGKVDEASWSMIYGWAWSPAEPGRTLIIDVVVDGEVVVSAMADQPRPDLKAVGKGQGRNGFKVRLPRSMFATPVIDVIVRDRQTGVSLAGSPITLENDEAGLDPQSQAFIERRIAVLDSGASAEMFDSQTAFVLNVLDRLMLARQRADEKQEKGLRRWREIADGRPVGALMSDLLAFALAEYGGDVLEVQGAEAPEVSIVIPVHNQFIYTYACLQKIVENTKGRSIEVIMVDDRSTDETMASSFIVSGIRVVRNERRQGFVGSVMAGAAVARGRYLLLLNNDTEVQPRWLDELIGTFAQDPRIGVAGARLLFPSGRLQECGGIIWRLGDGFNYGRDQDPNRPEFRYMRDVDYVSGAALMIRRDVWDAVGGLSPEYAPGYYEDTDLCFKVREAGYRVVVQPLAEVAHHEGVSAGTDLMGGMKRSQRTNMVRFAKRWAETLQDHAVGGAPDIEPSATRGVRRRALFIDDNVPQPDRDAGSNVAVTHMRSLVRLGYQVHFVPSETMARLSPYTEALERVGIRCHVAPYDRSVEEVLRTNRGAFELIYLHRVSNARYASLARACNPEARVFYNVADLHHLRVQREARLAEDSVLMRQANRLREEELAAVASADCTIVHSTAEAALLAEAVPSARTAVIPWAVQPQAIAAPFASRAGVAFIGSTHWPNIDAVEWLLTEIMPKVWRKDPGVTLHLIGDHVGAPRVQALLQGMAPSDPAGSRVRAVGWVPDMQPALAEVRLTVAPLRFGAGLKGKLLSSMASGLPCVTTSCGAEGAELPPALRGLVVDSADELAALILEVHTDKRRHAAAAAAGLQYIEAACSPGRIDHLLGEAIMATAAPAPAAAPETSAAAEPTPRRKSRAVIAR